MRDITVDRPVDQSHFECNVCPWKSHLKRKVLHFNLTQHIETTNGVSPYSNINRQQARSSLATGHRVAGEALSYANKIWLPQTSPGVMLITGAFGQLIYVDCQADMVMVKLSSWNSIDRPDLRDDTWLMARAIAASLQ